MSVDQIYQDLNRKHPWLFPDEIINPHDQILQIIDVASCGTKKARAARIAEHQKYLIDSEPDTSDTPAVGYFDDIPF